MWGPISPLPPRKRRNIGILGIQIALQNTSLYFTAQVLSSVFPASAVSHVENQKTLPCKLQMIVFLINTLLKLYHAELFFKKGMA